MPLALPFRPAASAVLFVAAGVLGACSLLPSSSGNGLTGEAGETVQATEGRPEEAYQVKFTGVTDDDLLDLLRASSTLVSLQSRPPASAAALDNRIADDRERLDTVLRSEGYYDARIKVAIDGTTTPQTVKLMITQGETYRLRSYRIDFVGNAPPPEPVPLVADLGITYGQVAKAQTVIEAQRRLLRDLANAHRPLARVVKRDVVVDHDTHSMRVVVDVDAGPPVRFGPTTIDGLDRVREDYVQALLPWHQGDPFEEKKVAKARDRLLRSGLFDAVETRQAETADVVGELPMTIVVVEAKPRSISASGKYSTTEGFGGDVTWEHRNLFGSNEKLSLKAEANQFTQEVSALLTRPNWRKLDRELLLGVSGVHTNSRAFDELGGEVSARVRSPLTELWLGSIGPSLEVSQLKDSSGSSSLFLLGMPAILSRDDTKDRLDPHSGTRLLWQTTPSTGYFNHQSVTFWKNVLTVSGYQPVDAEQRVVLAGRVKIGSLVGESRENIPPNKRFYCGGGDSVRGYGYQKIGPLDKNNDPIGGRSLFEFSGEVRGRAWGNFGAVAFVDGGTVYSSVLPGADETVRFAAGPGLRYLTPIGPIRFDVAFPLNGRNDIDDRYQFYISIGQSF